MAEGRQALSRRNDVTALRPLWGFSSQYWIIQVNSFDRILLSLCYNLVLNQKETWCRACNQGWRRSRILFTVQQSWKDQTCSTGVCWWWAGRLRRDKGIFCQCDGNQENVCLVGPKEKRDCGKDPDRAWTVGSRIIIQEMHSWNRQKAAWRRSPFIPDHMLPAASSGHPYLPIWYYNR